MVKSLTIFKTPFWKNDDENGGAMNEAVKHCPANHVVIHLHNKKYGRTWGHTTPDALVKLIAKNNGLYEVITQFPHKVYFDIDCGMEDKPSLSPLEKTNHLSATLERIETLFPDADCAVSGSYTDTKISYHIILNNYAIYTEEDRQTIKSITKHICTHIDSNFDWKVYTKNRNMKCIQQSKLDGRVQELIFNEDWKKHMITCFLNNNTHKFPTMPEPIQDAILIEKSKKPFNIGALPKLNLVVPKDIVWDKITPEQVLGLLPYNSSYDFAYVHKVARFCYTNGITFEMYMAWLKTGNPKLEPNQQGLNSWNKLKDFPPCTLDGMRPILAHYYPDIKKDVHFRQFRELFDGDPFAEKDGFNRIQINRLEQGHYSLADGLSSKLLCIHLGMGEGKTAQTIDYLKANEDVSTGFLWLGHRQSLHQGTYKRIQDAGIECVDYLKGNSHTKSKLYGELPNISICVNSLVHLPSGKSYDTLVIDEIESVLEVFTSSDFMNKMKSPDPTICAKKYILNKLIHLVKNARKIIVLDAFITNRTLSFFRSIEPDITIDYVCKKVTHTKDVIFRNFAKESEGKSALDAKMLALSEICTDLAEGKKIYIFYPYKKDMAEIAETITVKTGKKVIFYNADQSDSVKKTLNDVNTHWAEYDCVIANTCITCGVNYDKVDLSSFDKVWLFIAGFIKPREAIQASARTRNLSTNEINVVYLGKMVNPTAYENDCLAMNCDVYSNMYRLSIIEDKAPRRKAFETFCSKAGYKMKTSALILDNELNSEIYELFMNTNCSFSYNDLATIPECEAERLQEVIMSHDATMVDKLTLKKFYFQSRFDENAPEEELSLVWDTDKTFFFDKLAIATYTDDNIFKKIQQENGWQCVIPPNDFVKRNQQIKISQDLLKEIFHDYKFRDLTPLSNKNIIFKNIINVSMGGYIIDCDYDPKTKNSKYSVNTKLRIDLPDFIHLLQNHYKARPVDGETIILDETVWGLQATLPGFTRAVQKVA